MKNGWLDKEKELEQANADLKKKQDKLISELSNREQELVQANRDKAIFETRIAELTEAAVKREQELPKQIARWQRFLVQ